jgi:HAMP domain-containing protein
MRAAQDETPDESAALRSLKKQLHAASEELEDSRQEVAAGQLRLKAAKQETEDATQMAEMATASAEKRLQRMREARPDEEPPQARRMQAQLKAVGDELEGARQEVEVGCHLW